MATEPEPDAPLRVPLSRERVLRAALVLADEGGIESLSMRKLARELGFEVMSLYNHVADKNAILDGIVDLVASEINPPSSGTDWRAAMRSSAISAHQVLLRHPWACGLWSQRWPGPARLHYMESLLSGLREAGFSVEAAHHGFHALNTHILGFTLQELDFPLSDEDLGDVAASFLREISAEDYPYVVEHVQQHSASPATNRFSSSCSI